MNESLDPKIEQFLGDLKNFTFPEGELPSLTQIYHGDSILVSESNLVSSTKIAHLHSEVLAIQKAQELGKSRYLDHCLLITSLEPCIMCAGAIIHARISEVWYLAEQTKIPGISSLDPMFIYKLNHFPKLKFWKQASASVLWSEFFLKKREGI